jgi:hypothetical protein
VNVEPERSADPRTRLLPRDRVRAPAILGEAIVPRHTRLIYPMANPAEV